jgi:hypothetical protein
LKELITIQQDANSCFVELGAKSRSQVQALREQQRSDQEVRVRAAASKFCLALRGFAGLFAHSLEAANVHTLFKT